EGFSEFFFGADDENAHAGAFARWLDHNRQGQGESFAAVQLEILAARGWHACGNEFLLAENLVERDTAGFDPGTRVGNTTSFQKGLQTTIFTKSAMDDVDRHKCFCWNVELL